MQEMKNSKITKVPTSGKSSSSPTADRLREGPGRPARHCPRGAEEGPQDERRALLPHLPSRGGRAPRRAERLRGRLWKVREESPGLFQGVARCLEIGTDKWQTLF